MQVRQRRITATRDWPAIAALAALCGGLFPALAWAQSTSFNVTVGQNLSDSERSVAVLGNSSLVSSQLLLRSLDRLTDGIYELRRRNWSDEEEQDEEENSAGLSAPYLLVAAGPASWLAVGAAAGATAAQDEIGTDFARLNSFSNLDYRFGDYDGSATSPAYDINTYGITVGADYRLNQNLVLGTALNYIANKSEFATFAGEAEQTGYSLSGFASWYPWQNLYLDTVARIASNDYDTRRQTPTGTAFGETDGTEYALTVGGGYQFNSGAFTFGPLARLTYTDISIDSYAERGAPDALAYNNQDLASLRSVLGVDGTYAIPTEFGVVIPQASAKWIHEYEDGRRFIFARPAAGGAAFGIPVEGRDSNFYRLAIGGTAILTHGRILFLWYETDLSRADFEQHTITAGARLEW